MSKQLNNIKIALRNDIIQNWEINNPVLLAGEMAIVSCDTTIRLKVGDGTTRFNDLPFIDEKILTEISGFAKISVDNELVQDFKMLHTSYDEYAQLVIAEKVDPHTMYVLSADGYDDQHGNRIANVGAPISPNDAATKTYVDDAIYAITDDYYLKSETSNDIEIAEALGKKASAVEVSQLSDALSAAISTDIKNLTDNYAKKTDIKVEYVRDDKKIYLSAGDYVTSVDTDDFIKDGMISAVTYDETTHVLCIVWNTDAGGKSTTINLSDLIDIYTAGYGLSLVNGEFSVDTEEIAQKSDLDNYYLTSETSSAIEISQAISDFVKISVDNTLTKDFKLLHISYDEYAQLVADGKVDLHTMYVLSADGYDDQIGNRIINLGSPISADDAATKNYVDSEIAKIPQPDLSEFMKLSSESAQDISSNLSIDGCLSVRNLVVQDSSVGVAKWGNVEGNVENQTDLVKVNYPLDNLTVSSEIVDDVTYKRFDIKDHTIATITLSDSTPVRIHFPTKPDANFCRDFIVKIKITSSTVPQVQFVKADNDTSIGFEYEDEGWTELEAGINYFAFTETERN